MALPVAFASGCEFIHACNELLSGTVSTKPFQRGKTDLANVPFCPHINTAADASDIGNDINVGTGTASTA